MLVIHEVNTFYQTKLV